MRFILFQVLIEQGAFIQVVLQDILDAPVGGGIGPKRPFAGIVQPFGPVGLMELDDAHGPFIAYLGIIPGLEYFLYTAKYVLAMDSGLLFKELGAPVGVEPMGATEMVRIGIVASLGGIAIMQGDTLMIKIDLYHACGVMDSGLLSYIAVWDTVVALIRGEVHIAHLLYLGPAVILKLIGTSR